jgi:hypothetical protein
LFVRANTGQLGLPLLFIIRCAQRRGTGEPFRLPVFLALKAADLSRLLVCDTREEKKGRLRLPLPARLRCRQRRLGPDADPLGRVGRKPRRDKNLTRYGLTPVELQPRDETGSSIADRLRQAIAAAAEAKTRCEDDLRRARAGSQFTTAGTRAGCWTTSAGGPRWPTQARPTPPSGWGP